MFDINFNDPIPIFSSINFDTENVPFGFEKAQRRNILQNLHCEELKFIPHCHTTHLETKDHLNPPKIGECGELSYDLNAPLITKIREEFVDMKFDEKVQFIIYKKENPRIKGFEGISPKLMAEIIEKCPNLKVIGINEPSFDPEEDDGLMISHKLAFKNGIYLIELLDLSRDVNCSHEYCCFLNIFRFTISTDAYPCCPVLYRQQDARNKNNM